MEFLVPVGVILFIATNHTFLTFQSKSKSKKIPPIQKQEKTLELPSLEEEDPTPIKKKFKHIVFDNFTPTINLYTNKPFKPIPLNTKTAYGGDEKSSEHLSRQVIEDYYGKPFPKVSNFVKNPKTTGSLELDGYCKELKIAFEYQGEQHYIFPSKYITKEEEFKKQIWRDAVKKKACEHCGIFLIIIPYTLWYEKGRKTKISREAFIEKLRNYINILESKRK